MPTSTINPRKNPIGRPPVDSEQVNLRIKRDLLDAIDAYQTENGLKSRPEAIRQLLRKALKPDE